MPMLDPADIEFATEPAPSIAEVGAQLETALAGVPIRRSQ
jgi:hypothetical protein